MTDEKSAPALDADKAEGRDLAGGDAGQSQENDSKAPSQLPDKFKGQTPEQIAKAYVELEKKIGEQSRSVEDAKKLQEQTDILLRAIWSDPDLYRQVEAGVKKLTSGESLPDRDSQKDLSKGDDASKKSSVDPIVSDLRVAEENRVLNDFFNKYGYNSLSEKERKDNYSKLAVSLAELVDPGGKRPMKEILSSIPLAKLPKYLDNAHRLANFDMIVKKAKDSALLSREENDAGAIGSFSASSGKASVGVTLTNREREIAQKMGISEEKYAKRKAQMAEEAKRI